jgi:hypothetical protein
MDRATMTMRARTHAPELIGILPLGAVLRAYALHRHAPMPLHACIIALPRLVDGQRPYR